MSSNELRVFWDSVLVGSLIKKENPYKLTFQYTKNFIISSLPPLSRSLPKQEDIFDGPEAEIFFSGLLPEERGREKLARFFHIDEKDTYVFLELIGKECAGALSIIPKGDENLFIEKQHIKKTLSENELIELIALLEQRPLLGREDDVRMSLAGAQDKIAIHFDGENIAMILGNAPTTHILKTPITGLIGSVQNEFFCMKLAREMGIDTPDVFLKKVKDKPLFIIERYDRKIKEGKVVRIHQEDFCQAMGIPAHKKYQNADKGTGPSIEDCRKLIIEHSSSPIIDQMRFLKLVIFNYLIGNSDAHAKNFSFLYEENSRRLAPAYDLLSTSIYEGLSKNMAMKIGGQYHPQYLQWENWDSLLPQSKPAEKLLRKMLKEYAETIGDKARKVQQDTQMVSHTVNKIIALIDSRAEAILALLNEKC